MKRFFTIEDFANKNDAAASLMTLLDPLKPFYSEERARLNIGCTAAHYEYDSVPMEAFARVLWGLAPFWAGGGKDDFFEDVYSRGLAAGTDPQCVEYWHTCRDFDQKFCEMAGLAFGLLLCPEKLWEPLNDQQKDNLTDWLWEINRHECCACNWQWFSILTNLALKVLGRPYSKERMESGLAMMEDYYEGGGWYRDGNDGAKDYYNPFVLASYGLIYGKYMAQEDPERCAQFRERSIAFAQEFVCWFAEDGSALAYGRSLTYRFAQADFFALALLTDTPVLPLPVVKGILTRHLAWWFNQNIQDNAGVLTIGYAYPNLQMSESYNAPGSPYWGLCCFAYLALPDNHPFWSAACAPLPNLGKVRYLEHAGMIVQRDSFHVVSLVPGNVPRENHGHMAQKYGKFAYSSALGFSISRSPFGIAQEAPDSMLSFQVGDCMFSRRSVEETLEISENGIKTLWSPCSGIRVETEIQPNSQGHLRIHRIQSEFACKACDCGFAIPMDDRREFNSWKRDNQAAVNAHGAFCTVTALTKGVGDVLIPAPNTNVMHPKTAIPMAVFEIHPGYQEIRTQIDYLMP